MAWIERDESTCDSARAFYREAMPDFFRADLVDAIDGSEPDDLPFAIVDPTAQGQHLARVAIVEKTEIGRDMVPILEELRVAFGRSR